jgi:hypothetical protein
MGISISDSPAPQNIACFCVLPVSFALPCLPQFAQARGLQSLLCLFSFDDPHGRNMG